MKKYLIKSASYNNEQNFIHVVFKDNHSIIIPMVWFTPTNNSPLADPFNLKIIDNGQTLCLGQYEAAADAIREFKKDN